MKLSKATTGHIKRPFVSNPKVEITTIVDSGNHIVRFEVLAKYKNESRTFHVVKNNVVSAWMKVETFLNDIPE